MGGIVHAHVHTCTDYTFLIQGQNSELRSELRELQEKNRDLKEERRVLLEQNRDMKELVHRMEKETNVRVHNMWSLTTLYM